MMVSAAQPCDMPVLLAIRHKAFSHFAPGHYSETEVQTLLADVDENAWLAMIHDKRVFIMVKDERIVGCCAWDDEHVRHLYVDPAAARTGVASQVLAHTERDFQSRTGLSSLHAGVAVYARPFYEANGYRFVSEERDWDGSVYALMTKTLSKQNALDDMTRLKAGDD